MKPPPPSSFLHSLIRKILPAEEKGQALVEAVVVLPLLILLIWGVVHLHLSAFYSARAEMAVRHAAWIKSVKENSAAAFEGTSVLFEGGIPRGVALNSFIVSGEAGLVTGSQGEASSGSQVLNSVRNAFSGVGKWIGNFLRAIPLTEPLTMNAEATLQYSVISPGLDPFEKTTRAYFANRYKHLYFHNIWDLFKESGSSDFPPMGDAAQSKEKMDKMIKDFESELEKNKDKLTAEQYQHYQEQLRQWKQWMGYV